MTLVRRAGIALATTAFGIGLLGAASPAHADTSWGQRYAKIVKTQVDTGTSPTDTSWGQK
ncbi:hypothetical protein [Nocardioides alkalitolerans]|uniref:hypothetical protein n=1 Tax=Nocardioides alkalitolerans TaxID=281714 RepID=UPI00041A807E|nr:hypothetical protein [Nocardioides alkalitolerans]